MFSILSASFILQWNQTKQEPSNPIWTTNFNSVQRTKQEIEFVWDLYLAIKVLIMLYFNEID